MTAWEMQHRLFQILNNSWDVSCPNMFMWFWESDIIAVSKSGYIAEYEIKVTVADYKRDFKKHKHHFLKHRISGPNRFIYALQAELKEKIDIDAIPEYAGMYLVHRYQIEVVKRPPLLHKTKITDRQKQSILRSLHYKAWDAMNTMTRYRIEKEMKDGFNKM